MLSISLSPSFFLLSRGSDSSLFFTLTVYSYRSSFLFYGLLRVFGRVRIVCLCVNIVLFFAQLFAKSSKIAILFTVYPQIVHGFYLWIIFAKYYRKGLYFDLFSFRAICLSCFGCFLRGVLSRSAVSYPHAIMGSLKSSENSERLFPPLASFERSFGSLLWAFASFSFSPDKASSCVENQICRVDPLACARADGVN